MVKDFNASIKNKLKLVSVPETKQNGRPRHERWWSFFKLRWVWSCSTLFFSDLCPLTIFEQYDHILSLYWSLWRKIGQPLPDITKILIKSLFLKLWHPNFGLAIGFQGQIIHLWHHINSEISIKEWDTYVNENQ